MIITRATLRGKPLDDDCKIAKISKHEYGMNDDRCYCYGLVDSRTDDTLEKWAKEIGEAGGCHCETTVHVYRKTFASETYRRTKNVKLISILLGHSSTAVTEKYYLVDDLLDIQYQALQVA